MTDICVQDAIQLTAVDACVAMQAWRSTSGACVVMQAWRSTSGACVAMQAWRSTYVAVVEHSELELLSWRWCVDALQEMSLTMIVSRQPVLQDGFSCARLHSTNTLLLSLKVINDVHVQYVNMYCSLHIVTVSYCVCIAVLYTVYATSPTVSSTRLVYTPLNAWRLCIPDDCGKSLELSAAVHPSRTPLQLLPFVVNSRLYC